MNTHFFAKIIPTDPVNVPLKNKIFSVFACAFAIFCIATISHAAQLGPAYPIILASIGASIVILLIIPSSPLAQPWPLIGGQLMSAFIGVFCANNINDIALAASCTVSLSVLSMLVFRCLHPPATATSLTPLVAGAALTPIGYGFVLMPVAINVAIILVIAIIINRYILHLPYPQAFSSPKSVHQKKLKPLDISAFTEAELNEALAEQDTFYDISPSNIMQLLNLIQHNHVQNQLNPTLCSDIMDPAPITVEFGTEIEDAWRIMHRHRCKALIVVNKAQHCLGIVTWSDFFKYVNIDEPQPIAKQLLHFLRRTPDVTAHKPESIGQIMSSPVTVMHAEQPIVSLIPTMSLPGFRQLPIVNDAKKVVGMITQAQLINALFQQTLTDTRNRL